jgi:membrane protein DedA with SNARE-associated domain
MNTLELISKIEQLYSTYGYWLVFVSSFIEITPLGFTIPGGAILAVGGFFAYGSGVNLYLILLFSWFGAWLTFLLAYYLGGKTGSFLVRKLHQQKNQERARILLKNHGPVILTTSMLANLTRFWIAYVAGEQSYSLIKFIFYSAVASLTWSSLMVIAGFFAGAERGNIEQWITRLGALSWLILFILLFIIYRISKKEFSNLKNDKVE